MKGLTDRIADLGVGETLLLLATSPKDSRAKMRYAHVIAKREGIQVETRLLYAIQPAKSTAVELIVCVTRVR